jgi:hypothetical protein
VIVFESDEKKDNVGTGYGFDGLRVVGEIGDLVFCRTCDGRGVTVDGAEREVAGGEEFDEFVADGTT